MSGSRPERVRDSVCAMTADVAKETEAPVGAGIREVAGAQEVATP